VTDNDRIWRFEGPKGNVSAKVGGSFFSNSALALRKAALAGLGIALVPRYTVTDELASGALVTVLPRYRPPSRPLVAVFPRVPVAAGEGLHERACAEHAFAQMTDGESVVDRRVVTFHRFEILPDQESRTAGYRDPELCARIRMRECLSVGTRDAERLPFGVFA